MSRVVLAAFALGGCPRGAAPPDYHGRPDAGGDTDTDTDSDTPSETDTGDAPCLEGGSVTPGAADRFLLRGTVVTPDEVLDDGEVLVVGDTIACVGDCAAEPDAAGSTVVETAGTIYPG